MGLFDKDKRERAMRALLGTQIREPEIGTPIGTLGFRVGDRVRVIQDKIDLGLLVRDPDFICLDYTAGTIGVIAPYATSLVDLDDASYDQSLPVRIEKVGDYTGPAVDSRWHVYLEVGEIRFFKVEVLERV